MPKPLLEYAQKTVQQLDDLFQRIREKDKKHYFAPQLATWEQRAQDILGQSQQDSGVAIALLGSTGVGKSTLINAVLETDIMPTSSYQACTAAALEITYAPRKTYNAIVEFISQADWEQEIQNFIEEVSSGYYEDNPLGQSPVPDKIWSLYQVGEQLDKTNLQLDDLLDILRQPLPAAAVEAFREREKIFSYKDARILRRQIEGFLAPNGRYWPIVQSVKIKGPFELLREGIHLVDLPGLNDPNAAREEVTRQYLKKVGFIWLVFDSKRPLPKNMTNLMQNEVFLQQLIMDGKTAALTLIGTQSDNILPALERENLQLPEDVADIEVFHIRNERVEERIRQQLKELSLGFNQAALKGPYREPLEHINTLLQQAPIFTLSATEYLCLSGMVPQAARLLSKTSQTQIPALRQHIQEIGSHYGLKIRKKALRSQFDALKADVMRTIQVFNLKRDLKKRSGADKQSIIKKLQRSEVTFNRLLQSESTDFYQKLEQEAQTLTSRWTTDFGNPSDLFAPVLAQWHAYQWQSLLKAVQSKGRYTSPTTKTRVDLIETITTPLVDRLALSWNEFFSQQLPQQWRHLSEHLTAGCQSMVSSVHEEASQVATTMPELQAVLTTIANTTDQALKEHIQHRYQVIRNLLKQHQQSATGILEAILNQHMQPSFTEASNCAGSGVKNAILTILQNRLEQSEILVQIQAALQQEVQRTLQQLHHHAQQLISACQNSSHMLGTGILATPSLTEYLPSR